MIICQNCVRPDSEARSEDAGATSTACSRWPSGPPATTILPVRLNYWAPVPTGLFHDIANVVQLMMMGELVVRAPLEDASFDAAMERSRELWIFNILVEHGL